MPLFCKEKSVLYRMVAENNINWARNKNMAVISPQFDKFVRKISSTTNVS